VYKYVHGHEPLTPREMQVLYLIVSGRSAGEAAEILRISQHSVRRHRRCIFEKLYVRNTAELLREGLRDGWLSWGDVASASRTAIRPNTATAAARTPADGWAATLLRSTPNAVNDARAAAYAGASAA